MQSRTTRACLPGDVQRDAKRSYRLFQSDPAHPSLQFKKLEGEDAIYSRRMRTTPRGEECCSSGARAVITLRMTTTVPDGLRESGWSGALSHRKAAQ